MNKDEWAVLVASQVVERLVTPSDGQIPLTDVQQITVHGVICLMIDELWSVAPKDQP